MRNKTPYFFFLLPPILLMFLWGCAATDTTQKLVSIDNEATEIEESSPVDDATIAEPETTVAEELQELQNLGFWLPKDLYQADEEKTSYDFPMTINKEVEFYLDFFQNKQRKLFTCWLERSTRYLPMIKEELREAGLPEDLAYLPMIESGYSLTAFSRAKAVGPWQFMSPTARDYGLEINKYVDERRDPEKATKAAVAYLSDLYNMFDDWQLAVAAYNAGGGKIRKGIKNYNASDFWELAQEQYLHDETKRYVPKLIAAIIIAKNPEKYGFTNINYAAPLEYETVEVPPGTSLRAVEVACGTDLENLRNLNRQLPKLMTPPGEDAYTLKVPVGKKESVVKNLSKVKATVSTEYKTHVVADNRETLTKICSLYDVNKTTLLKANNLRKSKLAKGQRLRIPCRTTNYVLWDQDSPTLASAPVDQQMVLHRVRSGETISSICRRYNVPADLVASWNGLKNVNNIKVGQQLALYLSATPGMDNVVAETIIEKSSASIREDQPAPYKVRKGDTLWAISQRFELTPQQIKKWNNIKGNVIQPGTVLRLNAPDEIDALSMLPSKNKSL
ncbi:MAG: LysM peptidoglycan-binding domain-containing protein [Pseudomonadota bacterium]